MSFTAFHINWGLSCLGTPCFFLSKLMEGLIRSLYKLTVFRQDLFPPVVWKVVFLYLNAFFGHRNNVAAKLPAGKRRLHKSWGETAEWREGLAVRGEHTTSPPHTTQHSHLWEWNRRWIALIILRGLFRNKPTFSSEQSRVRIVVPCSQ